MTRKLTIMIIALMILLPLTLSCATPELEPTTTAEPPIPAHYSTYTSEGLFSISYPPDWVPAISIMEEVYEATVGWMEGVDPSMDLSLLSTLEFIFFGGVPDEYGYYPSVNIVVVPRGVGYWTLDEILEAEALWCREYLQQYHENYTVKTVIDSKEAAIVDSQDYEPTFGAWRYLQAYVIDGEFVWVVTCGSEAKDFTYYEDDFDNVVRSLRILR